MRAIRAITRCEAVLLASIFLDFRVPNATTWFYLSLVLAIGLFFRFNRLLSLRNLDLIVLFLLVPALLFLRESQQRRDLAEAAHRSQALRVAGESTGQLAGSLGAPSGVLEDPLLRVEPALAQYERVHADHVFCGHLVWLSYLWLAVGSAWFLARCLLDLAVVRRPVFIPNLNAHGLAWLGLTLLLVLSVRTLLPPSEPSPEGQTRSAVLEKATGAATQAAANIQATGQEHDVIAHWVHGSIAIVCHVIVIAGLFWIGWRHFHNSTAGVAAGVLYLLLPYTAYHVKDIHHVFPAALLVTALACYRRPLVSGLILGIAAGMVYFPLLLVPLWLGFYRRQGAVRFAAGFLAVLVALAAYLLWDQSLHPELYSVLSLPDWRAWDLSARPTAEGLWTGIDVHYAYRVPLFVAYLALVVASFFWPAPKNYAHLIALSGAVIIGVQFWYADAGGIYVLWYLPALVLIYLRPNLSERFAPAIDPASDWLYRLRRWSWHWLFGPTRQLAAAGAPQVKT